MIVFLMGYELDWNLVPTWIQAIGALIASIGLIVTLFLQHKTLNSQQKTLEEQQKITFIEQRKFINTYLPLLEINEVNYSKSGQNRQLKFSLKVKENYLQNLKISDNFPPDHKLTTPQIISNTIIPKEYSIKFQLDFTFEGAIVEVEEYTGHSIILNFDDAFGNHYQQIVIYKGSDNLFLNPAHRTEK